MTLSLRQKTALRALALVVTALMLFPDRRACAAPAQLPVAAYWQGVAGLADLGVPACG